ncbi:MAG: hypothetical protein AAB347_08895 [Bacteroidota bacterium]
MRTLHYILIWLMPVNYFLLIGFNYANSLLYPDKDEKFKMGFIFVSVARTLSYILVSIDATGGIEMSFQSRERSAIS